MVSGGYRKFRLVQGEGGADPATPAVQTGNESGENTLPINFNPTSSGLFGIPTEVLIIGGAALVVLIIIFSMRKKGENK